MFNFWKFPSKNLSKNTNRKPFSVRFQIKKQRMKWNKNGRVLPAPPNCPQITTECQFEWSKTT